MNATVLQRDFSAALFDLMGRIPGGLRVGDGIEAARRFAVHRNNATVALVDALASTFPVVQALVGEDFFRAMARERVYGDPPRSPIIADYGEGFVDFIAGFAPAAGVPYLADVAQLEWLRMRAFHAVDASPVVPASFQSLITNPERLAATRVTLHPSCAWLRSDFAVFSIWNAHQDIGDLRDAALESIEIDASEVVLVMRPQFDVQVMPIANELVASLDALREGRALGEAIAVVDGVDDAELASRYELLLQLIVRHGLAVALDSPTE